jgi:hypothetical protein
MVFLAFIFIFIAVVIVIEIERAHTKSSVQAPNHAYFNAIPALETSIYGQLMADTAGCRR